MPRKPGPNKLPADVIELRGNRSHLSEAQLEERRASEVRARPVAPRMPSDLSPDARECWETHAPELEHLGLFTRIDAGAFRLMCEAYELAREARRSMVPRKADGTPDRRRRGVQVVVSDRDGMVRRHPAFMVWKQAAGEYRSWCIEFGCTPSSRVGLRPAAAPGAGAGEVADDDDAFFGT